MCAYTLGFGFISSARAAKMPTRYAHHTSRPRRHRSGYCASLCRYWARPLCSKVHHRTGLTCITHSRLDAMSLTTEVKGEDSTLAVGFKDVIQMLDDDAIRVRCGAPSVSESASSVPRLDFRADLIFITLCSRAQWRTIFRNVPDVALVYALHVGLRGIRPARVHLYETRGDLYRSWSGIDSRGGHNGLHDTGCVGRRPFGLRGSCVCLDQPESEYDRKGGLRREHRMAEGMAPGYVCYRPTARGL